MEYKCSSNLCQALHKSAEAVPRFWHSSPSDARRAALRQCALAAPEPTPGTIQSSSGLRRQHALAGYPVDSTLRRKHPADRSHLSASEIGDSLELFGAEFPG